MMNMEQEILQIVASIWESMLRLPVEASHETGPISGEKISACIHIAGTWQGAVCLLFTGGSGAEVTGAFLAMNPADAQPADIQDALGELTNMIGGNIKALLPGENHLSLPTVVDGYDHAMHIPGSKLVVRVPLCSDGQQFTVSLLRSQKQAA